MIKLYNTLSRQTEEFTPLSSCRVTFYSCGPTVYDYPHIGNWYAFIRWDILTRMLRASGYEVDWVMNITDVGHLISDADDGEDKLEKGARREGKTAWDVAAFYTDYFIQALKRLNFSEITHTPRATNYIDEQIALIKQLEAKGYTYKIDDGIYFDTAKFASYGKMARLDTESLQAGARVEYNPQKHNLTDFALWKFSPTDEKRDMEWWSPWQNPTKTDNDEQHAIGLARASGITAAASPTTSQQADAISHGSWGFPGWHIECSAMSMKLFGETIDIHAGGIDHIPVHHSNEIAQSEAATGKQFARYWLHSNFTKVDGKKMSKSLGNLVTLEDIEQRGYPLAAFRLMVLESHYQNEAQFTWDVMDAALNRYSAWIRIADLRWQPTDALDLYGSHHNIDFNTAPLLAALQDNLNTPQLLQQIDATFSAVEQTGITSNRVTDFTNYLSYIEQLTGIRLLFDDVNQDIKALLKQRQEARQNKNWSASDQLRHTLTKQGFSVNDGQFGQRWQRII